jgi:PPOX class probable F420-dependent enzyme
MIDFTSELGQRALALLKQQNVIWLTTVGRDQTPHPRPVWFYWDGESVLIYSQPDAHKIRHLTRSPLASLHFNTDDEGSEVVVLTGEARVDGKTPPADKNREYLRKYQEGIAGLGMTPEDFAQDYSVPIRFVPAALRGF